MANIDNRNDSLATLSEDELTQVVGGTRHAYGYAAKKPTPKKPVKPVKHSYSQKKHYGY